VDPGQGTTAVINIATALTERGVKLMPEILAVGGGGTLEGVGASIMKYLANGVVPPARPVAESLLPKDGASL
jgi:hypothetical protein